MRLLEFYSDPTRSPPAVLKALKSILGGKLVRIGGPSRVYVVGDQLGAIYCFDGTSKAFGIGWTKTPSGPKVVAFYVWNKFNINEQPKFELDIPTEVSFPEVARQVAHWIKFPSVGKELTEDEMMLDEARRSTDEEFIAMVNQAMPDRAHQITLPEMNTVADENGVQIPGSIRFNQNLKVDAHHWNLSGKNQDLDLHGASDELGGEIHAGPDADDPINQDLANLSRIKTTQKMAKAGTLVLVGRNPKTNKFFKLPDSLSDMLAQLERAASRQIEAAGGFGEGMEEQYDQLQEKVRLVAGGKSAFIKSLLITGAPSSGKSFIVMKTIRELGLKPGLDYVVKKGRISTNSMYRTLIERINGLVIFDDCDSVVEDKNAVNMLKGALDTDAIREISYDVRGGINTGTMDDETREEMVNAMSRIFRNKPEPGDLDLFNRYMKRKNPKPEVSDNEEDWGDELGDEEADEQRLHEVQQFLNIHLPNKIDFKGRIIFISNMDESEWDSAVLSRAFFVNMNFSSGEMLDYIDKIKGHIPATLNEEEKQEVMDYIRELYVMGKIKGAINFRLVQKAFDLRLTSNWKKLVAAL